MYRCVNATDKPVQILKKSTTTENRNMLANCFRRSSHCKLTIIWMSAWNIGRKESLFCSIPLSRELRAIAMVLFCGYAGGGVVTVYCFTPDGHCFHSPNGQPLVTFSPALRYQQVVTLPTIAPPTPAAPIWSQQTRIQTECAPSSHQSYDHWMCTGFHGYSRVRAQSHFLPDTLSTHKKERGLHLSETCVSIGFKYLPYFTNLEERKLVFEGELQNKTGNFGRVVCCVAAGGGARRRQLHTGHNSRRASLSRLVADRAGLGGKPQEGEEAEGESAGADGVPGEDLEECGHQAPAICGVRQRLEEGQLVRRTSAEKDTFMRGK